MNPMKHNPITQHLHDANESYFEHMAFTLRVSALLTFAGLAVLIHGLCPCVFTHTGSRTIEKLNAELQQRRMACEAKRRQG